MTSTLLENKWFRWSACQPAKAVLFFWGWEVKGQLPKENKFVLIAAPHSSNWDFVFFMLVVFKLKIAVHWMGKHTMFSPPFKKILKKLGGIPIKRSVKRNTVAAMTKAFNSASQLIVTIAPSGTRSRTPGWKTGFYHIAVSAGLPVVLGFIDYPNRTAGLGPVFYLTGALKKDMHLIQEFYWPFSGRYDHLPTD